MNRRRAHPLATVAAAVLAALPCAGSAQESAIRMGGDIPPEIDAIYERGLAYLARTQDEAGSWRGRNELGITGICLMAFLASGEDPNFGRYRRNVRLAIRSLILGQDARTGYFPNSMYHHGFAMLALAEAYGAYDESALWDGTEDRRERRSIAEALDMAIELSVEAQGNNRWGGWRYSPTSTDADTSVTGAILMGLLACRNAGLAVPQETIDNALTYMKRSTGSDGFVAYSGGLGGGGESMARSAVAALVYAVAHEKESDEYGATLQYIAGQLDHEETGHRHYYLYYMAQALYQGDYEAWSRWNGDLARQLVETQADDGSFAGSYGEAYGTAMSLLALALNYRFLPIYERF